MSADGPSLDDLIRAHRSGVRLPQRAKNRERLTRRLLAGSIGAASASSAASLAFVGSVGAAKSWLVKGAVGLILAGGAGAAIVHATHPAAPANVAPQPTPTARPAIAPPASVPVAAETANPAPAISSSVARMQVTRRLKRSSPPTPPPTTTASLAVEVQLMHDVDAALKAGRPERALVLLDERREGDGGYMREERAAARVFALCQLGRVESARAAASQFLRERPRSPLAARVKSTCAAGLPERSAPETAK